MAEHNKKPKSEPKIVVEKSFLKRVLSYAEKAIKGVDSVITWKGDVESRISTIQKTINELSSNKINSAVVTTSPRTTVSTRQKFDVFFSKEVPTEFVSQYGAEVEKEIMETMKKFKVKILSANINL